MTNGTRRGWGVNVTPRLLFTSRKDPVPVVQEAGWAPGPVCTGAENLAPPLGLDHRTVQPVASRYTDYATRPTTLGVLCVKRPHPVRRPFAVNCYRCCNRPGLEPSTCALVHEFRHGQWIACIRWNTSLSDRLFAVPHSKVRTSYCSDFYLERN
jgi:hypothetical protein